jgi:hypothetical protein
VRCRDGNERTDHPPEASHHRSSQEGNSIRSSAEGTALGLQYHPILSPSIQIDNGGFRLINAVLINSVCTRATNAHHCSSPYQNTVANAAVPCRAFRTAPDPVHTGSSTYVCREQETSGRLRSVTSCMLRAAPTTAVAKHSIPKRRRAHPAETDHAARAHASTLQVTHAMPGKRCETTRTQPFLSRLKKQIVMCIECRSNVAL